MRQFRKVNTGSLLYHLIRINEVRVLHIVLKGQLIPGLESQELDLCAIL